MANSANAYTSATYVKLSSATSQLITSDIAISGNLTITGQTTYANTTVVNLGDSIITLNADIPQAQSPSENAGIEIDRGSLANVSVIWNESTDKWTFTNDGTTYEALGGGSSGLYANGAFIKANAAYQTINTNSVLNRGQYIQANNTINFNVAITSNGSDIAGGLSPFLLMGA